MIRIFKKKDRIVYFPGCIERYAEKHLMENWKAILQDLDIEYEVIKDIGCCGSPARTAGYLEEFEAIVKKNKKKLDGVSVIISSCPHCVHMFEKYYGLEAKYTSQILAENKDKIMATKQGTVTYHDPCTLARKLSITEEPREAIRATGLQINEFARKEKKTICCGASGGLLHNHPARAKRLGKNRLKQAKEKTIVVGCPLCYYHLKQCSKDQDIKELSELYIE